MNSRCILTHCFGLCLSCTNVRVAKLFFHMLFILIFRIFPLIFVNKYHNSPKLEKKICHWDPGQCVTLYRHFASVILSVVFEWS